MATFDGTLVFTELRANRFAFARPQSQESLRAWKQMDTRVPDALETPRSLGAQK
jgi:hypothetical protein